MIRYQNYQQLKNFLNKVGKRVSNEIYSEITSKTRNPADALPTSI